MVELCSQVANAPRSNLPGGPRQAAKQKFIVLMRESMWIPTIASLLYAVAVHGGPLLMKPLRPLPLKWLLAAWNLALALFSAAGSYHCLYGLISNVRRRRRRQRRRHALRLLLST